MSCPACRRPCISLPVENLDLLNVINETLVQDATGFDFTWEWPVGGGALSLVVIRPFTTPELQNPPYDPDYGSIDFKYEPAPTVTTRVNLTYVGFYQISWRREVGAECSPWKHDNLFFVAGVTGAQVVHQGIPILHNGEIVLHTRIAQLMLAQNGDFITTNQEDPQSPGNYFNISY